MSARRDQVRAAAAAVRRLPGRLWRRGGVELGIVGVALALLVGAVVGTGAASAIANVSDGLTWIGDDASGQVVQIDPETGRPQNRLQVAPPGSDLTIAQGDGTLVVTDERTGQVTAIDLATLLASGRRQGAPDGDTKVLVSQGRVVMVDLDTGLVRRVEPTTLSGIGSPLQVGPLADAVVDAQGVVWLAGEDGTARSARWSEEADRFVVEVQQRIDGTGPGTVLVPHPRGVTAFGPGGGVVVQVGTDGELATVVPGLRGTVQGASSSPADFVPVTVRETASVVILSGGQVREVALGPAGCAEPGRPEVFDDQVWVPCGGAGKVLVLGRDGTRAAPDVPTADGGDAQLVVDDGHLVISTPGAEDAVVVGSDGTPRTITVREPGAPVQDANRVPPPVTLPPVPSVLQTTPPRPPERTEDPRPSEPGPSGPASTTPGTTTPPGAPGGGSTTGPGTQEGPGEAVVLDAPTGVSAVLVGRFVRVTWQPGRSGADSYRVQASGGGVATTASGGQTSVNVTGLADGSYTFVVVAERDGAVAPSGASAAVRVGTGGTGTPVSGSPTAVPPTTPVVTTTRAAPVPPTTVVQAPPTTVVQAPPTTVVPPPTTEPPAPPPVQTTTPAPPPAPTGPQEGDTVVTSIVQNVRTGIARVQLSPPATWQTWGSCTLHVEGAITQDTSIACTATSAVIGQGEGDVTAWVEAVGAGVSSARVSQYLEYYGDYCGTPRGGQAQRQVEPQLPPTACQIPFAAPAGTGSDGRGQGIVWAVGLVGVAGLVRTLRTGSLLRARPQPVHA